MPGKIAAFVVVLGMIFGSVSVTLAQDGSPEAGPPARDISLLQALGLPEINLVATGDSVTGLPKTLAAGRYLVTLENQTSDQEIEAFFSILPASVTPDQAIADLSSDSEEIPAWVYDATWAGGPNSYGGQTDAVVVQLSAGDWWVAYDRSGDADPQPADTADQLTVTGDLPAAEDVPGAVQVSAQEFAFVIPDSIAAGAQIWDFTNTGKQPHFIVLWGVPDGTTTNQVMGTIGSFFTGTPTADALGFEELQDIYDTAFISNGQHLWIQLDLEPGTYAAVCFFEDKDTGQNHSLMGMVQVFTVA